MSHTYEEAKDIVVSDKPTEVLGSQDINCLGYTTFRMTPNDNLFPCFIMKKSLQIIKYFISIESTQKVRILSSTNLDTEKMTISLAKTHARQLPKVLKSDSAI